jgi:FKBP-type peptidyl-prolyl cis-trans isomerase
MCTVMTIRKFMNSRHLLMQTAVLLLAVMVPPALADSPIEITAGGMQYKTLLEGEGSPAVEGQVVHIHFVGWLDEGGQRGKELFNSRRDKGLISYVLGTDKVLPAFNEGVVGMKAGGRRLLMVPPVFAYGEHGVDDVVPPDSSLILLIDLISVDPD